MRDRPEPKHSTVDYLRWVVEQGPYELNDKLLLQAADEIEELTSILCELMIAKHKAKKDAPAL